MADDLRLILNEFKPSLTSVELQSKDIEITQEGDYESTAVDAVMQQAIDQLTAYETFMEDLATAADSIMTELDQLTHQTQHVSQAILQAESLASEIREQAKADAETYKVEALITVETIKQGLLKQKDGLGFLMEAVEDQLETLENTEAFESGLDEIDQDGAMQETAAIALPKDDGPKRLPTANQNDQVSNEEPTDTNGLDDDEDDEDVDDEPPFEPNGVTTEKDVEPTLDGVLVGPTGNHDDM